ncbi:tetraspanin-18-like [Saccostrea echinata]|uniref:tetraspanin-18-like n=1 Tax=Saccostrea echinata TaxID=191078 RepID=UPI002A82B0A1|nr:tetraspanin-18-like [Saccostrea echinata]
MAIVKNCGRQIILLINGLFGLVGLLCFVGGMFVKYGSDDLKSMLPDLMNELVKKIDPILKATHKSSSDFLDNLDLEKLLGDAAVVFIVFGAILLFIVFWGCYGISCKSKCALYMYGLLLVLILIGQIVCAVLVTKKRNLIDDNLKPQLRSSLKSYYLGDHAMDAISVLWNAIMLKFSCCGIESYEDFTGGVWNRTPTADIVHAGEQLDTPLMCCTDAERSKAVTNWWMCATQPLMQQKSNFGKGCYDEVWRYLEKYVNIVVGCVGGLIGLELLLAFLAIYIAKSMDKKNKVDSEKGRKRKK